MTCIVGLAANGRVYIGGDSAGTSGWDLAVRADAKVFGNGPFVMGFTTSFRMGQLLRWKFTPPEHPEGMDDERFMATVFMDAVRQCFRDGGYLKKDNEREEGGTFLVGYRGNIWSVEDDYQYSRHADGFAAVGSGAAIARGCLYATGSAGRTNAMEPSERVRFALTAAERFSAGVRAPFVVVSA